jgi:hypothetical protein
MQGDRKVTQPMLKYLLMVATQYNSTGLINTQFRCDYTRSHAGHVTCSLQSASCLQTVEVQGCLFHKCNECSLSNTTWHLVLTSLTRMSLGIHFPILLFQTNRQYLVWWTVSVTQELFTGLHQTRGEEWIHASLNAVDISNTSYNIVFCFFISV